MRHKYMLPPNERLESCGDYHNTVYDIERFAYEKGNKWISFFLQKKLKIN